MYFRILITAPYLLLALNKARRHAKIIKKDPNMVSEESRYHWVQRMSKYILWLCKVKIIAHDIENWVDRGCLLVGNHQTNFDPLILFSLNDFYQFAPIAFIGKKELLDKRTIRNILRLIDVIFLDRKNLRDVVRVIKEAGDLVRIPRSVVLFPEGTRSHGSKIGEFKGALYKIAQKTHAPIIPFTILNSHKIKKNSLRCNYVHIFFHKPLAPQGILNKPLDALAKTTRSIIEKPIIKHPTISYQESTKMYKVWKKLKKSRAKKAKE